MSAKLISRNPDLQKLQGQGYEVEVRGGYLLLHSVPYVNSERKVAYGVLVTDLTLNNEETQRPSNHQAWFSGEHPCNKDGSAITALGNDVNTQTLYEGIVVNRRFSCKPADSYADYHAKMTRYVEIISNPARALASVDARTFKVIRATEEESVFLYTDTASSRAHIANLAKKLAMNKIAIVGLGGTGSYVLDLVAKTHVREIHLFDGDTFLQHNAFRAPGAASTDILGKKIAKVDYYAEIYRQMRRGIVTHPEYLNEETIQQLSGFDFVFICVDKATVRKLVTNFLRDNKIPFIDCGMELEVIEEQQSLVGVCRVTLSTPEKSDHFFKHVSLDASVVEDDVYDSNIQVADLNALNAALAVVKWKKYCGFYQDCYKEHQSAYAINAHQLTRDETTETEPQ